MPPDATPRLAAGLLVAALVRRAEAAGGGGMVLARGDATAGAILIQLARRGIAGDLVERVLDAGGAYRWTAVGPADDAARDDYVARRRRGDPDLWVVELDADDAAALVAEVTA